MLITKLVSNGSAEASGIETGDLIVSLDGTKITNIAEIKAVMFDRLPDDLLQVTVRRRYSKGVEKELKFEVRLR